MPTAFLVVSIIGALLTINAYRPLVRGGPLSIFAFFAGWLASELPYHRVVVQLLIAAFFISQGALDAWQGWAALALIGVSWLGHWYLVVEAHNARDIVEDALKEALGDDYRNRIEPGLAEGFDPPLARSRLANPFRRRHDQVAVTKDLAYGPYGRRNTLDVYRRVDEPDGCPVLLQVHGGAWVIGDKNQQGWPLMSHLAAAGWVCVAINYRLGPRSSWPDMIVDVKKAITWVKDHVAEYGGNPDFIVITGGSAGGHLSSLAALTANAPEFQPGFEDRDTTVQGCVPFYGVYDFTNREGVGRGDMRKFLERMVMKSKLASAEDVWDQASPMGRVNADAPPMLVIHGKNDTLVPVAEARLFVRLLRAVAGQPVAYAELPGAQHAFEVFTSIRTVHVINAVERFVAFLYSSYCAAQGPAGLLDERGAAVGELRRQDREAVDHAEVAARDDVDAGLA
jgi:acetyl esterase/lipase